MRLLQTCSVSSSPPGPQAGRCSIWPLRRGASVSLGAQRRCGAGPPHTAQASRVRGCVSAGHRLFLTANSRSNVSCLIPALTLRPWRSAPRLPALQAELRQTRDALGMWSHEAGLVFIECLDTVRRKTGNRADPRVDGSPGCLGSSCLFTGRCAGACVRASVGSALLNGHPCITRHLIRARTVPDVAARVLPAPCLRAAWVSAAPRSPGPSQRGASMTQRTENS